MLGRIWSLVFNRGRSDSLKGRFARGGAVLTMAAVLERGLRFVRMIILAKLIVREELGLVALCTGVLALFEAVSEVGIRTSVIQNKEGDEFGYLNAAWWFQAVRGVFLGLVGMLTAGFLADFYGNPQMANLLRVAFLAVIFNGLVSSGASLLERRFQFGRYVLLTQGSMIAGTVLTIVLAFIFRNVWVVIIGLSSEGLIKLVLSFILCPVWPRFSLDRNALRGLGSFARGMFGVPLITLLTYQADVFVLGKMVSMGEVGMYAWSLQMARIPREMAAQVMGKLLLPVFSRRQDDNGALQLWLCEVTRLMTVATGPLMGFLVACSPVVLKLAYRPEFAAVSGPFSVLVVAMFFRAQAVIVSNMYLAIKQLNLFRMFVILRGVVLLALIIPMTGRFGLMGAALAVLISEVSGFVLQVVLLNRRIELPWRRYMECLIPGFILAAAVQAGVQVVPGIFKLSDWGTLLTGGAILAGAYLAGLVWQLPRLNRLLKEHSDNIPEG